MEPYYEKYYKHHAPPANVMLHRETDLIASVSFSHRSDPEAIISALAHAGFNGILIDCIASGGKFHHEAENLKLYAGTAEKYSMQCGLDIPCAVPGKTSRAQQTFRKQLRELLACGATLFEVRLNNTEQMGKPEWDALYHAIRQSQPEAIISGGPDRRRGSRNGILPDFSSSRYIPRDCFSNGEAPNNVKSIERHYALGNPFNGQYWNGNMASINPADSTIVVHIPYYNGVIEGQGESDGTTEKFAQWARAWQQVNLEGIVARGCPATGFALPQTKTGSGYWRNDVDYNTAAYVVRLAYYPDPNKKPGGFTIVVR